MGGAITIRCLQLISDVPLVVSDIHDPAKLRYHALLNYGSLTGHDLTRRGRTEEHVTHRSL
jgi:hypothetical protein